MRITILLTAAAMVAFAANSLLARLALAEGAIDAASFTAIRLISGAVALGGLLLRRRGRTILRDRPGNWPSALCLFAYALAFSLAYLRLGAATGALILFATVQAAMIAWGLLRKDRPTARETIGLAIAFAALAYLLTPGLHRPDPLGSALMALSGLAWAGYSLRGRGAGRPLDETAGNFVRAALVCLPLAALPFLDGHATPFGVGLALLSGIVASGFGYAIWYSALPRLSTTQAATVQLSVPVIAAFGAVLLLSETLTLRLTLASVFILGGIALATLAPRAKSA